MLYLRKIEINSAINFLWLFFIVVYKAFQGNFKKTKDTRTSLESVSLGRITVLFYQSKIFREKWTETFVFLTTPPNRNARLIHLLRKTKGNPKIIICSYSTHEKTLNSDQWKSHGVTTSWKSLLIVNFDINMLDINLILHITELNSWR